MANCSHSAFRDAEGVRAWLDRYQFIPMDARPHGLFTTGFGRIDGFVGTTQGIIGVWYDNDDDRFTLFGFNAAGELCVEERSLTAATEEQLVMLAHQWSVHMPDPCP